MTVAKLVAVQGGGSGVDRSQAITEAIKQACYDHGDGAPISLVIGCLEIAKMELLDEAKE